MHCALTKENSTGGGGGGSQTGEHIRRLLAGDFDYTEFFGVYFMIYFYVGRAKFN